VVGRLFKANIGAGRLALDVDSAFGYQDDRTLCSFCEGRGRGRDRTRWGQLSSRSHSSSRQTACPAGLLNCKRDRIAAYRYPIVPSSDASGAGTFIDTKGVAGRSVENLGKPMACAINPLTSSSE
jgi:hypothetical protein